MQMGSLENFIKNRGNYENLAFFGWWATLNQTIGIFYITGFKMPNAICYNKKANYDTFAEENISIYFEKAFEKSVDLYVAITDYVHMNGIVTQILKKIQVGKMFYFTSNKINRYIKELSFNAIDNFVQNRHRYNELLFFADDDALKVLIKLFYRCSMEMPEAICDSDADRYDLCVDGVIPIMSLDSAMHKFENPYIIVVESESLKKRLKQVHQKVPKKRVIYLNTNDIIEYIKKRDYSNYNFNMPKHMKKIEDKLKYYQYMYTKGNNIKIRTDDFFIKSKDKYVYLVDYMNQDYFGINDNRIASIYRFNSDKRYLTCDYPKGNKEDNIADSLKNVIEFNKYLKDKNIEFVYVQAPIVVKPNENDLHGDFEDCVNKNADRLVVKFRENNINVLDFREYLIRNEIDFKDWFYKTDPHWTARAAFTANKEICVYIKNSIDCNLNYDYLDINNYNIETHKNKFIGTFVTLNSGLLYAHNAEDFEMITPNFKTDLSWTCAEKGYHRRGEAKKSLVFHEHLHGAYYSVYPYAAYSLIHENYVVIKNHLINNNKKIFMINNSFGNALAMFISQQFKEVHFFDPRRENVNDKLFEAIEDVKPDIVLMLYHPPATMRSDVFDVNPNKK